MSHSEIEIAKQRAELAPSLTLDELKRRKRELDLKIKYFENDPEHEKFKQNTKIQELLKSVDRRIKEKREILSRNQNARILHLREILDDIEAIERQIETQKFVERFEIAKEVAKFMRENPNAKLADLRAEDFTQNPELQNDWENILEDVLKGMEIETELKNPKFDVRKPETWKNVSAGEAIRKFVKEQPKIAAAAALGLGITAIALLFSKSKIKKVVGGITGFLAGMLGFELWKPSSAKMIEKATGFDEKTQKKIVDGAKNKIDEAKNKFKQFQKNRAEKAALAKEKRFEKWTPKQIETLKKIENPYDKELYEALINYSYGVAITRPTNVQDKIEKLEAVFCLNTQERTSAATALLTRNAIIKLVAGGTGAVIFGTGFFLHMQGEVFKSFQKATHMFDSTERQNDFVKHYGLNALYIAGVGSMQEIASTIFAKGVPKPTFLRIIASGVVKGITWPIYSIEVGSRMVATSSRIFHKYLFLGKIKYLGDTLRLIDAGGRMVASFSTKMLGKEISAMHHLKAKETLRLSKNIKTERMYKKGIKRKNGKLIKEAIKKRARAISEKSAGKLSQREAHKLAAKELKKTVTKKGATFSKETLKKGVGKLRHLKVLRPKLIAILAKGKAPKEALKQIIKLLPKPAQITVAGAASLGTAVITAIIWDAVFPEKVGAANEAELLKRSSILHQEFGQQKLPVEYVWWISREDRKDKLSKLNEPQKLKIAEAIHAANARIENELPGTPLFEIPPELEKET